MGEVPLYRRSVPDGGTTPVGRWEGKIFKYFKGFPLPGIQMSEYGLDGGHNPSAEPSRDERFVSAERRDCG